MLAAYQRLRHLYRATFAFGLACGISIALTPLYLDAQGYTKRDIGLLALFFASGLVAFALPVGGLIRRWGGKRTLSIMLAGYAVCVGLFPFVPGFGGIAGVRFLDGVFSVGVWVASETILLSRSDAEHKAQLTSLYAIWLACGYVAGPVLARLTSPYLSASHSFVVAGLVALAAMLYVVALVPSDSAGEGTAPHPEESPAVDDSGAEVEGAGEKPSWAPLFWRIKTSCLAAFSYGYFQASVVLFLPLYLIESKGIARDDTIVLPGIFCLGMLLASNLVGRVADRLGHLRVVTTLCAVGTACVLGFVFLDSYYWMCAAVFGAGATFASMSPVALALIGVVTPPRQLSHANSIYNVCYASGMLLGPPLTSWIFQTAGGAVMLYHLGALWGAYVLFALVFATDDPAAARSLGVAG
ncbi:MAG TPA: MFS transporter [Polyangiaceae bacterium]|nr:MFS transporter [Polyangiaceae bacterium]